MIRKLNITIAILFLAMVLLKGLLMLQHSAAVAPADRQERADVKASPEITFYYLTKPPFQSANPISRHNGFLADQLRAIFPRMKMVCCDTAGANWLGREWSSFTNDPHGVICTFRESNSYQGYPCSETPLGWLVFRLFTLRDNPWKYTGPESLDKVELCILDWTVDHPFVKEISANRKTRIIGMVSDAIAALNEKGTCRAFLEAGSSNWNESAAEAISYAYERGRRSKPLAKANIYLRVNNRDPDFAREVIRTYEEGMKRITESGERHRICEYYGFVE